MSEPSSSGLRPRLRKTFGRFLEESSLLRTYLWRYRKYVGFGLAALALVDLLELLPPIFLKNSVDLVVGRRPRHLLGAFALAYLVTSFAQGLCRYAWRIYLIRSSMWAGRDIRSKFASHLFSLSSSFYDKHRIGDLMSLATNDTDSMRMAMGAGLLTFADAVFYIVSVPIAMLILSPKLTLIAFLPLPLIPWFVVKNEREIHDRFKRVQEAFSRLAAMAQENLNGIRVVKAFAREDARVEQFRLLGEDYIRLNLDLAKVQTAFGPTLDLTMSLGLVLLLMVGGRYTIQDAVTLGTFVAFQRYIQKMVWPMTAIGFALTYYQRAVASSNRMKEVLAIRTEIISREGARVPPLGDSKGIEFRNLSFTYPGASRPALQGINLRIEPGQRTAFVGAIGSGKTTLLALLPRLYPVQDGMIFVDGLDINRWPLDELRQRIGYVGQDVFLFSESVIENVAFGLFEWQDTQEKARRIRQALKTASVEEEVLSLIHGENTRLGERGVNLSGGQKQRLTVARAAAREPSILILDDALSSVDVRTEERILKGLRERSGKNIELIAAHRISTVKEADQIVVLHEGQIERVGTHSQLIADRSGIYHRFHEQQRLGEDLARYIEKIEAVSP